jgi:hypothetical protein
LADVAHAVRSVKILGQCIEEFIFSFFGSQFREVSIGGKLVIFILGTQTIAFALHVLDFLTQLVLDFDS